MMRCYRLILPDLTTTCRVSLLLAFAVLGAAPCLFGAPPASAFEYRVLATSKTSTMEKELNEAADAGYRFDAVMGGETAIGGAEVVAVMSRHPDAKARFSYKLLATSKTSTMEKELQEAAEAGFEYRDQTVFKSLFGGTEVICILEREADAGARRSQYKLLATTKTSTLQKELQEAGAAGYQLRGMTVAKTAMGGKELVAILRREGDR